MRARQHLAVVGGVVRLRGRSRCRPEVGVRVAPPVSSFQANRPPGSSPVAVQVSDGDESTVDRTVVDVVPPGRLPR